MLDLDGYTIVLGSSSERRLSILKEVLKLSNIKVIKPDFEENLPKTLSPKQYVHATAGEKLLSLRRQTFDSPTILICCDTIINCNGKILEKPQTKQKQREMFQTYRTQKTIEVISSVHIAKISGENTQQVSDEVMTTLYIDTDVLEDLVELYIESEEGLQVAGGFKYQELGNILFLSISGDYFNVVGLPAKRTFELLYELSRK